MKKFILDFIVSENTLLNTNYCLLKLTCNTPLPEMQPGQFVEVLVNNSATTFLRRPISIHFVDRVKNEIWLLIQVVGDGTRGMCEKQRGDTLNLVFPLGNGFSIPTAAMKTDNFVPLLVGGGVGIAPLLFLGAEMHKQGIKVNFLLGARTANDLLQLNEFAKYGTLYQTTEDGSLGEKGFVTHHSVWKQKTFNQIYTCGPTPMMKAVGAYASMLNIPCEVSLENTMACGVGACLCCVTKVQGTHKCVCTEGPVFEASQLDEFLSVNHK